MKSSARSFVLVTMTTIAAWGCDSYPSAPAPTAHEARMSPGSVSRQVGVNDGAGKVWRQLIETTALSWNQAAQVCPRDGETPCTGIVGGRDLRSWIWGSAEQVRALLGQFEPAVLDTPSVSGMQYFFTADAFFRSFRPTFSFALTYQAGQNGAGWTSSMDANGAAVAAAVSQGNTNVSIGGSFSVADLADPDEVSGMRGVFLWHAAGSGVVDAVNDAGSTNPDGGTAVANVLANDSFAGAPAALGALAITQLSTTDEGVTLDASDGSIHVAPSASVGVKRLEYSLCEVASATNCDIAAVTVTVVPYAIDAVDDAGSAVSTTNATAIANVLANDRFNGAPATLETVAVTQVSTTNAGVTLDASDGSLNVAAGTSGGVQTLVYRICETANPTNCDQASARVTVVPQTIVVSASRITVKEGQGGSFTVRLSQQPTTDVVVTLGATEGTATVTAYPATLTFTADNWSTPATVAFQTAADADKDNNAATIQLSSTGLATVSVVVQVTDVEQPAGYPTAMLESPLNGQTLSGVVDFWGTGTDSNGQVVEARFSVDGVRVSKVAKPGTVFRMGGGWNTRMVANGWHTLELRVIDNAGNDGRMLIKVLVSN